MINVNETWWNLVGTGLVQPGWLIPGWNSHHSKSAGDRHNSSFGFPGWKFMNNFVSFSFFHSKLLWNYLQCQNCQNLIMGRTVWIPRIKPKTLMSIALLYEDNWRYKCLVDHPMKIQFIFKSFFYLYVSIETHSTSPKVAHLQQYISHFITVHILLLCWNIP